MEPEHEEAYDWADVYRNDVYRNDVYRNQRQQAATKRMLYGAGALEPHERLLLMRPIIATEKDVGTDILQRLAEYGIVKKDL